MQNHQRPPTLTSFLFLDMRINDVDSSLPTISPTSFLFSSINNLQNSKPFLLLSTSTEVNLRSESSMHQKVRRGRESPWPAPARTDGAVTFSPSAGPWPRYPNLPLVDVKAVQWSDQFTIRLANERQRRTSFNCLGGASSRTCRGLGV
jgi:hypothetical protein